VLEIRNDGGLSFDAVHAFDVFDRQRQRFTDEVAALTPEQWATSSRCDLWTAHDVLRHLCDVTERLVRGVGDEPVSFDGFDPRTTPNEWMQGSQGEPVHATFARFRESSWSLFDNVRQRLADGDDRRVPAPYGVVPWPVLVVHAYWDSWVHERDVLLPLGLSHSTDDDAVRLATAYAMFVAANVAAMFRSAVTTTVSLSGVGGGTYEVTRDGDAVVVRADRSGASSDGPDAITVVDALTGRRGPSVPELLGADATPLAIVGEFFNTPA
jgi:uncharacterized protein (TIGR03083 family)